MNTQNPTPAPDMAVEREKFEARVKFNPANPKGCLALDEDGEYASPFIYAMWTEFQAGAEFARAALARPQEVAGVTEADEYLCRAWGETDKPVAAIVNGLDGVRRFLIDQWLGDENDSDLPSIMADIDEAFADEREWSAEFEIGGISVAPVCDVGTPLAASRAPVAVGVEPERTATRAEAIVELNRQQKERKSKAFPCSYCNGEGRIHHDGRDAPTGHRICTPCQGLGIKDGWENPAKIQAYFSEDDIAKMIQSLSATPSPGAGGSVGAEPEHGFDRTASHSAGEYVDTAQAQDAAPVEPPDTLQKRLQKKCTKWKTYWRGPDAHGVQISQEQAIELLQDALGVEVEIEEPEDATAGVQGDAARLRVIELMEKAFMPAHEAQELILSEGGVTDAALTATIEDFPALDLEGHTLMSRGDLKRFASHVFVWLPFHVQQCQSGG